MRVILPGALLVCLTGCGFSSGLVTVGPETYTLVEERSPVLGGGLEADRVVRTEAGSLCLRQGRVGRILDLRPAGDPFTIYYPTGYALTSNAS